MFPPNVSLVGKVRKLQVVGLHTVKHLFWQQTVPQPTTLPRQMTLTAVHVIPLDMPGRSWKALKHVSESWGHTSVHSSLFFLKTE